MTRAAAAPVVVLVFLLDAVALLLMLGIVAIAITGGGAFDVAGTRISARSVGNPLAALLLVGLVRYAIAGVPAALDARATALVRRTHDWLASLTAARAWRIVLALSLLTLLVKLLNAWLHPGFFSGDDVEVQEMSLGALFGMSWPAWTLRSAFFPMVFVYPAHAAAAWMGAMDPGTLVAAGRTAVAVLSTGTVAFVLGAGRREAGLGAGVIAAFFVATSHLLVNFGGTELPRPVSAMLLAGAYALLLRATTLATVIAAVLVGVAAALRFSEAIFVLPAVAMLVIDGRRRAAVAFVIISAAAGLAIQAIADQMYWGSPFFSLREAIDYTLVQRQSTRGFQPPWHYLATIPEWTTLVIAGLAGYAAWRRAWRPALWAGLPIVVLSALPHKEARYLLPIVPFLSLLAGIGLWKLIGDVTRPGASPRAWAPIAIVAGVAASTALSISGFHVRRSDAEVALAKTIAFDRDISGVGVEQLWRWGGRIYIGHVGSLQELDGRVGSATDVTAVAQDASLNVIAIRMETCDRIGCIEALRAAGLDDRTSPQALDAGYRIFRRVRKTPPSTAAAPSSFGREIASPSRIAANAIATIGTTFE